MRTNDIEDASRAILRATPRAVFTTFELATAVAERNPKLGEPRTIASYMSKIAKDNPDIIAKAEPFVPKNGPQKGKVCHHYTWRDNPEVELPIKRQSSPNTQSNDTTEALALLEKRVAELERRVYLIMDAPFNPEA